MPVELSIVESVTELDTTVVEVILESASAPGPAGPGVATGGTVGQVLTKQSGTDFDTDWEDPTGGGGVTDADYLVGTAHGSLSAEIVVGTSPGGELGGTWASPTVDATHSGSSHASVQAAAEATAASELATHSADTTGVHGITDTSALALTANVQPLDSDLTAIAALTTTSFGRGLLELANQAALLSAAGAAAASHTHAQSDITSLVTDLAAKQPLDSDLTAIAALTTTSFGRAFLAFADEAAFKAGVNLEAGTDFPSLTTFNDHSARHENGGADEISIAGLDGTPVELTNHLNDTSAAHAASAVSADSTTLVGTGTDVQAVLEELDNGIADHLADTSAAHAASAISFTPNGSIAATDVQAAIQEVRDEAGGGGAPTDATYITQTANGTLSNEQALSALSTGIVKVTTTTGVLSTAVSNTDYAAATHASRHNDGGADEISLTGLSGDPADTVNKSLYDANTVLAANSDNTPAALTMGASTILARLAAGNIKAASTAEIITLLAAYTVGGTDVALADGGTGASLTDPNADRIMFWDDSAGAVDWLTAGTGLSISGTTITATGGGGGTITVPIVLTNPRTASLAGNSFFTVAALTDWDAGHWEFLQDVDGKIYGHCRIPANYASGGTLKLGIAANATSGVSRLQVGTKAVADGESVNPTLTDETAQDITVPGTAYLQKVVSFSLTETLAAGDLLIVEIFHAGAHANDTLATNTLLFSAWLEVTT